MVIDDIMKIVTDRGMDISQADLQRIKFMSVDVPLEQSESLAWVWEAIALTVNDPAYRGNIPPVE